MKLKIFFMVKNEYFCFVEENRYLVFMNNQYQLFTRVCKKIFKLLIKHFHCLPYQLDSQTTFYIMLKKQSCCFCLNIWLEGYSCAPGDSQCQGLFLI